MNLLLFIYLVCGTALLPLLYFSVKVFRALLSARQQKQKGLEAQGRILQVEMMNKRSRTVPFARLKVEVFACNGEPFIADVEGFYSHDELQGIKTGAIIWVSYQPCMKAQLQLVKKPASKKQATGMFVIEGGKLISAKTNPIQSPEARHLRLVSQ